MALKPDRGVDNVYDISYFMNVTGERGIVVTHSTAGSGSALDQGTALVVIPSAASGSRAAGVLMNDVVDKDLTYTHLNQHKQETQKGGKVTILRRGWIVTNNISGTPTGTGETAYFNNIGNITPTDVSGNGSVQKIGAFLSKKDADGYAKVEINITG